MRYLIILLSLLSISFYGQSVSPTYHSLVKKADSLCKTNNYKESAFTYSQAFQIMGWKGLQEDRYKAACAWALAGYPDSAIFNLERITFRIAYSDYQRVINEESFKSLYNNNRWKPLIIKIKSNQDSILAAEEKIDKKLASHIDSMAKEDQKWRNLLTKYTRNEIPKDSISWDEISKNVWLSDISHYPELRKIFLKHGFPNYDLVGKNGSHDFWYLVQHQDQDPTFQDSVLKAMKIEAEKGKASWKDYAYLIDRVKCNMRELQIYGTQVQWNSDKNCREPRPVIEPEKLNERRKSVGLDTEEEYIKYMDAIYSKK
jgi:uncharacterized protein DUF6624